MVPQEDKKARSYTGAEQSWRVLNVRSADTTADTRNNRFRHLSNNDGCVSLYCDLCGKKVSGETAMQHCRTAKHRKMKAASLENAKNKAQGRQSSIRAAVANISTDPDLDCYRFVFTACAMKQGVPIAAIDGLRPAIDPNSKYSLTDSAHFFKNMCQQSACGRIATSWPSSKAETFPGSMTPPRGATKHSLWWFGSSTLTL